MKNQDTPTGIVEMRELGVGARSCAVASSLTSQDLLSHSWQSLQAAQRRPGLAGRWAGVQNGERHPLHLAKIGTRLADVVEVAL